MGPFGSGKSSACVIEIIRKSMLQEPGPDGIRRTRWAVIRNTYPQLNDTTIKTFMEWIPDIEFGRYNKADHVYTITSLENCEIEILFRALDNPGHVKNLLSLELTGAWLNEAREIPWEIFKPLLGRVGRYKPHRVPPTWSGVICDTNPPDTDSWWFNLFETETYKELSGAWNKALVKAGRQEREYIEVFKQPSGLSEHAENLPYLEPGYYELLAADPDLDWVKVHVMGEYGFIKDGKPVYPQYRDNFHCMPVDVIPGKTIIRGWDYGLTPACVFIQVSANGRMHIIDELCAVRSGISDFTDLVIKHSSAHYPDYDFVDIGDPAGGQGSQTHDETCFQIQIAKGLDIEPGIQSPVKRLESVRYGLTNMVDAGPGLIVDPKCTSIRRGFQGGYQYKRVLTSGVKYADKPDKNKYSHPHDALQYVAVYVYGDIVIGFGKHTESRQPQDAIDLDDPLAIGE